VNISFVPETSIDENDLNLMIQENNGNAENSRRSGRIARKSSVYAERKKQAEELENKLKVSANVYGTVPYASRKEIGNKNGSLIHNFKITASYLPFIRGCHFSTHYGFLFYLLSAR